MWISSCKNTTVPFRSTTYSLQEKGFPKEPLFRYLKSILLRVLEGQELQSPVHTFPSSSLVQGRNRKLAAKIRISMRKTLQLFSFGPHCLVEDDNAAAKTHESFFLPLSVLSLPFFTFQAQPTFSSLHIQKFQFPTKNFAETR